MRQAMKSAVDLHSRRHHILECCLAGRSRYLRPGGAPEMSEWPRQGFSFPAGACRDQARKPSPGRPRFPPCSLSAKPMLPRSAPFPSKGEMSAAIEVRRLFPGITDNAKAQEHAGAIAGWKRMVAPVRKRSRKGSSAQRRLAPSRPMGSARTRWWGWLVDRAAAASANDGPRNGNLTEDRCGVGKATWTRGPGRGARAHAPGGTPAPWASARAAA
jgi:hypothetical protein